MSEKRLMQTMDMIIVKKKRQVQVIGSLSCLLYGLSEGW